MADGLLITSLENAFVGVIGSAIAGMGAFLYPGHSSADKVLPLVIAAADGTSLEEDPPHSGNFWVDVEISVKATAATDAGVPADPVIADQALTRAVFNSVKVPNLDALLNAQGQDLTVFPTAFFFMAPKAGRDGQGVWTDTFPLKVYCCASVLLP